MRKSPPSIGCAFYPVFHYPTIDILQSKLTENSRTNHQELISAEESETAAILFAIGERLKSGKALNVRVCRHPLYHPGFQSNLAK
jgi:hypothetical protein